MTRFLASLVLSTLACLPLANSTIAATPAVAAAVNESLGLGGDYADILESLTSAPYNLTLEEATATAIEVGGDTHADAFAAAGISAAANLAQAESVAAAARAASASTSTAIDAAMEEYVRLMDQPFIHHDPGQPTGGGAYNPQGPGGGIVGGTRPPVGGTRPPVSPAS